MKKKILYVLLGVTVFTVGAITFKLNNVSSADDNTEKNNILVEAKTDGYNTVQELENDSPIIVKGTKVKENPPTIKRNGQGDVSFAYTLSYFKINEILKNKSDIKLKANDKIPIIENEADDGKNIYHIAGYTKMKENKDYILLLHYSESDKWYVPTAATFGKIPLDEAEPMIYEDKEMRRANTKEPIQEILADELREKYID